VWFFPSNGEIFLSRNAHLSTIFEVNSPHHSYFIGLFAKVGEQTHAHVSSYIQFLGYLYGPKNVFFSLNPSILEYRHDPHKNWAHFLSKFQSPLGPREQWYNLPKSLPTWWMHQWK
jgi:hypothetical protein